jgi:TonB family protein
MAHSINPGWQEGDGMWSRTVVSIVGGIAASMFILLAIAQAGKAVGEKPTLPSAEIRAVALPPPPPPVPEAKPAVQTSMLDLELEPSPTPSPTAIQMPMSRVAHAPKPTAKINLALSLGDFRPAAGDFAAADPNRAYNRSDVDQVAVAIFKQTPNIDAEMLAKGGQPWVTLLFVVNRDGTVGDVRVIDSASAALDRSVVEAIRAWRFTPARKRGKPVRQWCELRVSIRQSGHSPFSLD